MHADRPSATAFYVALHRAAHQLRDTPLVLDDPLALRIVGKKAADAVRSGAWKENDRLTRRFRIFLATRSRYVADELATAIAGGVRQYVVLGAGLDTSAYRQPHAAAGLRIFEVDHPATQAWKRTRLAEAGIAIPPELTFAPVDFERQSVMDGLRAAGFSTKQPAFFSWLGVVPYLTWETIQRTLASVVALPTGTTVVFDYVADPASLNLFWRLIARWMARRLARAGEPWRSHFIPAQLAADLRAMGFRAATEVSPAALNQRYCRDRTDGLTVGPIGHLMQATV